MRRATKNKLGWLCVILGIVALLIMVYNAAAYYSLKADAIATENTDTVWTTIGAIYITASIGTYLLLAAGIAGIVGLILVLIGIIFWRR
jgi:multidrug transporter EmrE-like cation transporter